MEQFTEKETNNEEIQKVKKGVSLLFKLCEYEPSLADWHLINSIIPEIIKDEKELKKQLTPQPVYRLKMPRPN
ncbi:MAG: hypothetical protein M1127_01230 [Patescibacteria group bacterium]|nr:hypothetical protein [Patescibacteria group bacterium]